MTELRIGCHLSAGKGFRHMAEEAKSIGANTFQFFTRNPRGGKSRAWEKEDLEAYRVLARENGMEEIIAHAPYTLNPSSSTPGTREFALQVMAEDLEKLEDVPGALYNFHPGSHTGQGTAQGVVRTAEALNAVLTADGTVTVLLETMSGKGSEIGGSFREIAEILSRVHHAERMGVCLDTCHVWDAGYDIRSGLDGVLEAFDREIGLDRLRAVHLNDSKNICGSRKDRHEKLGRGMIGFDALLAVTRHPALCHLPFVLETPNELEGYALEIRCIREGRMDAGCGLGL